MEYVILRGRNYIYQINDFYTDSYKREPETYKIFRSQTEAELFVLTYLLKGDKAWTE